MLNPIKRNVTAPRNPMPVLWRESAWSPRVLVRPFSRAGAPLGFHPAGPVTGRRSRARDGRTPASSLRLRLVRFGVLPGMRYLRAMERSLAQPVANPMRMRFGTFARLSAARNGKRSTPLLNRLATGVKSRGARFGFSWGTSIEPLLALTALPLGGAASSLSLCHIFQNTQTSFL